MIYKEKNSWIARISLGKSSKRKSKSFKTRREAVRWEETEKTKLSRQLLGDPDIEADISECARDYVESIRENGSTPEYADEIEYVLSNTIRVGKIYCARDLTAQNRERWLRQHAKKTSLYTSRRRSCMLHGFGVYLRKQLSLSVNPYEDVWKPNVEALERSHEIKAFSKKQLDTFLRIAKRRVPMRYYLFYALSRTGCRLNELLTVEYSNFDFKNSLLKIRSKPKYGFSPKSKWSKREIPLDPELKSYIFNKAPRKGLIFGSTRGKICSRSNIARSFKTVMKDPEMVEICENWNDFHPHSLRHTWVTHMLESGAQLKLVREWAGHSSIQVTELYISKSTDPKFSNQEFLKAIKNFDNIEDDDEDDDAAAAVVVS